MSTATGAALPGFNQCVLNNRRYTIGEVFHPVVEVDGREYEAVCYDCTCQPVSIRINNHKLTANSHCSSCMIVL